MDISSRQDEKWPESFPLGKIRDATEPSFVSKRVLIPIFISSNFLLLIFPPFKRRIPRFLTLIKLFPPSVSLPFHFNQVHLLQNNPKQTLGRGDDDWFLLLTPQHLGRITHIKLWSSYSGGQPDWYCYKVEVRDFDTRQKYLFFVQRWLSVLQDTEW